MFEIFNSWIVQKFKLHSRNSVPSFKTRDVFWCAIGQNIGDEENGKSNLYSRPVVVIRKFNKNLFWGVPLTTKIKENDYYFQIRFKNTEQSAMITHLRLFDAKRLYGKAIGRLDSLQFENLINEIKNCI